MNLYVKMYGAALAGAGLFAAVMVAPAFAADLPVKAPVMPLLWDTGGIYIGINTGAEVASASVSGNSNTFINSFAAGNLRADGGVIGGTVGWMGGNAASWRAFECEVDYRNIQAGVTTPLGTAGIASRWEGSCEGRIGFDPTIITTGLNAIGLGNITFPTFTPLPPPGAHVGPTTRTYIAGGVSATGVSGDFGVAGGSTIAWAPHIRIGTLFQAVDATTNKATGGVFDVSAKIAFYDRGFQINNFLDPTHNLVFAGQSHLERAYMAELSYKFAPGGLTVIAPK